MEDPDWIGVHEDQGRGRGSMWRRFNHARKKFLHRLHNKRKTKLICDDPDETHTLLDYKQGHINDSETGNGNSWSDELGSNAKSRLMKSGSYPPPGNKRRGGYKPSTLKDKEIDVWVSINSVRRSTDNEESCRLVKTKQELSADKYSRLYGCGFGKESIMLQSCRSLSVRKEPEIPFLPLRRIRSVSSAESINLHHQVESPRSASFTASLVEEKPIGRREKIVSIDDVVGLNLDGIAEEDSEEFIVLDISDSCKENEEEEDTINLFSLDVNSNNVTYSPGSEERCNNAKDDDLAINKNESLNAGSVELKTFKTIETPCQKNPDISYIMGLLERSGFNGKLYLREQPLSPSLYKEMEAFWHQEVEECYHHKVIFDLVNEVLVHMCDRSFTYYPRALFSGCRVLSLPPENSLSEVVCGSISSLLRLKSEVKNATDGIVGYDLEKDDGWMSLQLDGEDVALELEDLAFDDLLDELIFDDLLDEFFYAKLQNL